MGLTDYKNKSIEEYPAFIDKNGRYLRRNYLDKCPLCNENINTCEHSGLLQLVKAKDMPICPRCNYFKYSTEGNSEYGCQLCDIYEYAKIAEKELKEVSGEE